MEWKRVYIENNPTNYLISENGLLKNRKTKKIRKKLLTKGYIRYFLGEINGKNINKFAHRLVAEYFLEVKPEKRTLAINHKDGNKTNNHYTNLEYVTNQENTNHAIMTGLFNPLEQSRKKINVYSIDGTYIDTCESVTEASIKYTNSDIGSISDICNRKNGAKIANHYQFRFYNDCNDIKDLSDFTSGIKQPVRQYSLNGEFIREFATIAEANASLGKALNSSLIGQCCKGKNKSAYKYIWEYKK